MCLVELSDFVFLCRDIWSSVIDLSQTEDVSYRYFVCLLREADTEGEERDVMVLRWETNVKPRIFSTSSKIYAQLIVIFINMFLGYLCLNY